MLEMFAPASVEGGREATGNEWSALRDRGRAEQHSVVGDVPRGVCDTAWAVHVCWGDSV